MTLSRLSASCLLASLGLAACAQTVSAPASRPAPENKPALSVPPPSVMTPSGY